MHQFEIYGRVLDHEFNPKKDFLVEVFHVAFTLPPMSLPLRYFLGISETNEDGRFRITFPTEAYGVIDKYRTPNIELRISEKHHLLHKQHVGLCFGQNSSYSLGEIIIPPKFVYSDELNHMDYKDVLEKVLPEIIKIPGVKSELLAQGFALSKAKKPKKSKKEHIKKTIPEYYNFMQNEKRYVTEEKRIVKTEGSKNDKSYSQIIVPKHPKTSKHEHNIPWNSNWPPKKDKKK